MRKFINPLAVRMPTELHDRVRNAAKESGRSLNSELIARLERSFSSENQSLSGYADADLIREILIRHPNEPVLIQIGKLEK